MEIILSLLTAFFACIVGKICGMGGGVVIKPVLDALGIWEGSAINFMSGCTVLGMTSWSVVKSAVQKNSQINWKISTPLAIGAALGGIAGKRLYLLVSGFLSSSNMAGGVQAVILLFATAGTLLYTLRKDRIVGKRITAPILCVMIGAGLGMLGAFLGIGGGPFNMAFLFFFFSMDTKVAAQNSLYIILISQLASLLLTFFQGAIPDISWLLLSGMVLCGIAGSEAGTVINKKLDNHRATLLFEGSMVLVMGISLFNMIRFFE